MEKDAVFVKMALHAWNVHVKRTDDFLNSFSDEDLQTEIAPGKNRIIYLIGHLIAVNDNMIALFGLGNRSYAQLDDAYVKNPDKAGIETMQAADIRKAWKQSTQQLLVYFQQMQPADWFAKHTAMTDEDLLNDPGRNKLSVLLNRTNHLAYHLGQLILAKRPLASF